MTPRERAEGAKALEADPVLGAAIKQMRQQALENLAVVNPGDAQQIMRLQAQAEACDNFRHTLQSFIVANGEMDGGVDL